jgi:nucleotide-binding universal stress UspA family protein
MLRSNIRRDPAARDLIIMAAHGRQGITGELVGSETARVITNCKIPVLVYR